MNNIPEIVEKSVELIENISNRKEDKVVLSDGQVYYRGESHVLLAIAQNPGIFNSEIARRFSVTRAVTNKMIKKLMERELITRCIDETDRKRSKLYVTDKGKQIVQELVNNRQIVMKEFFAFVEGLCEEEKAAIIKFLDCANQMYRKKV